MILKLKKNGFFWLTKRKTVS